VVKGISIKAHLNQLDTLAAAVSGDGQQIFWNGERVFELSPKRLAELPRDVVDALAVDALRDIIYLRFYLSGGIRDEEHSEANRPGSPSAHAFVQSLQQANAGSGWLDHSWHVESESDQIVGLRHDSGLVTAIPHATDEAKSAYNGSGIRRAAGHLGVSPGFYTFFGEHPLTADARLIRIYIHVQVSAAADLVRWLSSRMRDDAIPFQAKVVSDPLGFDRCDSAVLYIARTSCDALEPVLGDLGNELSHGLEESVPALTTRIARGIGYAEDPGDGESHGIRLSRVLANSIYGTLRGAPDTPLSAERLADALVSAGIVTPAPPWAGESRIRSSTDSVPRSRSALLADETVAGEIAGFLCRKAVWDGPTCTWITAVGTENEVAGGLCGADLYGGSAGIGFFLAEFAHHTGNQTAFDTACGALRHALSRSSKGLTDRSGDFHSGPLGVAAVAMHVGRLLPNQELFERGRTVLLSTVKTTELLPDMDLLGGSSGSLFALLIGYRMTDESDCLKAAIRLADEMLQTAERSRDGLFWPSSLAGTQSGLTGFAHGASGIAASLLDLDRYAADGKYVAAAELAMDHEDGLLDREQGNWPDLRGRPQKTTSKERTPRCLEFWCHGAPGIALARLEATRHFSKYEPIARIALDTTAAAARRRLTVQSDRSLCHGLGGLAAILEVGARALPEGDEWASVSRQIMEDGAMRFGADPASWPTGLPGIGSFGVPGLMLGTAGIGWLYLSHSVELPSPLRPSTWT
jgi:hypothetical protein